MAQNRIIQLRKSRGLTQRALAEVVGTSQQQVQRIEAGVQGVRLELALKIASALGADLEELFPTLKAPKRDRGSKATRRSREDNIREKMLDVGIDPDPRHWTLKVFAFDGRVFLYFVPSEEKKRLESIFASDVNEIVVFSTISHQVALNPKKIAAVQFLFDIGIVEPLDDEDDRYHLKLHLVGASEPILFGVEPDERRLDEDEDGSSSQLQNLFTELDMGLEDQVVYFDDEDAERVYIRPKEMLAIEVPLICCEPDLWDAHFNGYLEDEGDVSLSENEEVGK